MQNRSGNVRVMLGAVGRETGVVSSSCSAPEGTRLASDQDLMG